MYELDLTSLENNMTDKVDKGKISHKTGNKILLFPFPGNDTKINDLKADLIAFKGIAGACYRNCMNYSQSVKLNKDKFINEVCSKAHAPNNYNLKDIIENIAFDENEQLITFNAKIYAYLDNYVKNKTLNDISKYIVSVFIEGEDIERLHALATKEPDNLMHRLILSALPDLKEEIRVDEFVYRAPNKSREKFKEDFLTLTKDHSLFVSGFPQLLKVYFFLYISDLIFQLNSFFEEKRDRYFFSLSWEKLQASRLPMINGWKLFEKHIASMFTHANTLELLNHIKGFTIQGITYVELKELVKKLSDQEKAILQLSIENLISFYQERITKDNNPFDWKKYPLKEINSDEPIFNLVYKLWQMVDVQFQETERKKVYSAYRRYFLLFTQYNYTRRRGRNGYSLSIDQESLLFLTTLCIGPDEDKIRLSKLWSELEDRGFLFDQISKSVIVDYFEKINLLEKKSDSGDAQYVRKLR
ncbi:DNA phosphorothioation-dependent restriction protein DptG [Spirosoma panaciterrae]|uniref:DNA phosphorothioation-dependent restriction protein DptG n=1 Tax=Spirosoma panaciterrae TaxID=496058 RepID=UPI0003736B9C|nr:DNA phosphorothioation-dependent restriction protein DptG [Spirosoma panaciterrae]